MSLTVREKDHWRQRIERRIDLAIEELQASSDPGFSERIREQAEQAARKSLGLQAMHDELEAANTEISRLKQRNEAIAKEMWSTVTGKPSGEGGSSYRASFEVESSLRRRRLVHEKELMSAHPLGSKILRLQHEKEELLDTVWLATSSAQIKELWKRFADVLKWEPPTLQQKAMEIDPETSEQ